MNVTKWFTPSSRIHKLIKQTFDKYAWEDCTSNISVLKKESMIFKMVSYQELLEVVSQEIPWVTVPT